MKSNSKSKRPALNRDRTGKFQHGCSGNPKGRRPGIPDRRTELRALLEPSKEKLIRKAVALALAGDTSALRLCIERLIPAYRATSEPIAVDVPTGSLTAQAESIFRETVNGKLLPEHAIQLIELLNGRMKIYEVESLTKRIEKLEAEVEGGDNNDHER